MFTESVSESGPPVPLLPWSFVVIVTLAVPLKPKFGVKLIPLSAALILAMVPVKVIVASAVPSPTVKARPLVPLSVNVPFVAVSVTWMALVPASTSETAIRLPPPLENVSGVFCAVLCEPGTVLTGASSTAVILMPRVACPVLVPSFAVKVTVLDAVGFSLLF